MQLPRVIIAAVFFVIGALIAIPALTSSGSSGKPNSTPAASATSPSPSASASASASASISGGSGHTSASASPHKSTTPGKGLHTTLPIPSVSISGPVSPLSAAFSSVGCPSREVRVTVTNAGPTQEGYTVQVGDAPRISDRVLARGSRTTSVTIPRGTSSLKVLWNGVTVKQVSRTATCTVATPSTGAKLPHTGPDSAGLYAKIATGIAAMVTGVIIFWWGGIWPRRREAMFGDKPGEISKAPRDRTPVKR